TAHDSDGNYLGYSSLGGSVNGTKVSDGWVTSTATFDVAEYVATSRAVTGSSGNTWADAVSFRLMLSGSVGTPNGTIVEIKDIKLEEIETQSITKSFTLTKSKTGADGASARLLTLTSD